jgi:uncharacterized protein (AIM24 family)
VKADTVGGITPAVLVQLHPGEKILAAHEIMLHMDGQVKVHRKSFKQLGVSTSHLLSMRSRGDTEEGYFFAEFEGPGNVTFSRDKAGEVRILQLAPGQGIRLRSGHLICFDETVRYYPMVIAQWQVQRGNDRETEYIFADELTGPGTIVFQSHGNILSFNLQPGEAMRTSTEGWLASSPSNGVHVNWLAPRMGPVGVNPHPVLTLVGPGPVMVHSGV